MTDQEVFWELCWCLLAPAERVTQVQRAHRRLQAAGFYRSTLVVTHATASLKGLRFQNQKAERLWKARGQWPEILAVSRSEQSPMQKREWLVKNVKGLGMKAASHFLRNCGLDRDELAILDVHICRFLKAKPPTSEAQYLELERRFVELCKQAGVSPGEADVALWESASGNAAPLFEREFPK